MADKNRKYWNEQFKILQDTWPKPMNFEKCIGICLEIHAMVHSAKIRPSIPWSFEDELWEGMKEETFRKTYNTDQSIAWKIWHCSRIEDITMNILIAGDPQIVDTGGWLEKMNINVRDTGNSMDSMEIQSLSKTIDIQALKDYRLVVGKKTISIINNLRPEDLKRKMDTSRLQRVFDEGAVTKEAIGILDYWGGKTYSGLLLMPATRHNLVHLNESLRIKYKSK